MGADARARRAPDARADQILDLGCGPGEPACHFAAPYAGVPTIASDLAPNMVALAEKRVAAKGLANVECMVLAWRT